VPLPPVVCEAEPPELLIVGPVPAVAATDEVPAESLDGVDGSLELEQPRAASWKTTTSDSDEM
jgi:hypothetical protein